MIEMTLLGLAVELSHSQPLCVLATKDRTRMLPLSIGGFFFNMIQMANSGMKPVRPLTHDLFASVLKAAGRRIECIKLVPSEEENRIVGLLVLDDSTEVESSPADAVVLALKHKVSMYMDMELSKLLTPVDPKQSMVEAQEFRTFLDGITASDFNKFARE